MAGHGVVSLKWCARAKGHAGCEDSATRGWWGGGLAVIIPSCGGVFDDNFFKEKTIDYIVMEKGYVKKNCEFSLCE
jgi:hypothetical protein